MPKRKLSDFTDNAPSQDQHQNQNLKLQTTRLKQKFDFGVTALSRALKAARGFERQKLGRRQKTAKAPAENAKPNANPEETAKRIEREIAILKTLDPTATAEKYLFKQLAKTKRIAEAPIFYRFKQSKKLAVEGPKSAEEANVTARLFKSNPVKNVLPEIMDGLRGLFGLLEAQGKTKGKDGGSGKATKDDGAASRKSVSVERRAALDVSGSESESESGDAVRDMEMEDAGSDEEDYSRFDARLASDSEDNDDDDVASDDDQLRPRSGAQLGRSDMSVSLSPSPSRSPSPSQSPPQKKPKSQTKAPATSTTFLPSLMMGGYWSGSESEPEEVEEAPKRKNRMGQQARRALWEKKYGASANHVKEQQKGSKKGRDSGWDLRKGATGDGDNGRRKFGTGSNATAVVGEKKFGQSGAGKETQGRPSNKKPDDNKPLHPSWEAARKAKEQKSTASFQGKKLVFD